jgi:hypothetical protein
MPDIARGRTMAAGGGMRKCPRPTAWIRFTLPNTTVLLNTPSSRLSSWAWESSHSIENADSATCGGFTILRAGQGWFQGAWRPDLRCEERSFAVTSPQAVVVPREGRRPHCLRAFVHSLRLTGRETGQIPLADIRRCVDRRVVRSLDERLGDDTAAELSCGEDVAACV